MSPRLLPPSFANDCLLVAWKLVAWTPLPVVLLASVPPVFPTAPQSSVPTTVLLDRCAPFQNRISKALAPSWIVDARDGPVCGQESPLLVEISIPRLQLVLLFPYPAFALWRSPERDVDHLLKVGT